MALTTASLLYAPEVWEDTVQAVFTTNSVLINAALTDDTLVGRPGDTVVFPRWDALTDLDILTEGVAMVPEALSQSSSRGTILEAGKAVEITDDAILNGVGDPQAEATRQLGLLAARRADADLIAAASAVKVGAITSTRPGVAAKDSAPLTLTGTAALSWNKIVDAVALLGDGYDPADMFGLVIRSSDRATVHKDPQFISAAQTASGNDIIRRGQIGQIGGMNVYVSDRIPAKQALIVKQGALGLRYKRRPIVETDRDILRRTNVIATNVHYAAHRLNDKGVVVLATAA